MDFSAGTTLRVKWLGKSGGAIQNDKLLAMGPTSLGSCRLDATFAYPPSDGDIFPVIRHTGGGATMGTFAGLANGTTFDVNGYPCVIRYDAGNGADVVLTVTNLPLVGRGASFDSSSTTGGLTQNDCSRLTLVVTNRTTNTILGLHGTLRSLTSGLIVTSADSDYPDLAPGARGTNSQVFQISTEPSFQCSASASQVELLLTSSNLAPISIRYDLVNSVSDCSAGGGECASCVTVRAALDDQSLLTTQRLARVEAPPAFCFSSKQCPGISSNLPPARYRVHAFTNSADHDACVTVKLTPACSFSDLGIETAAAYLGAYHPDDICGNYLGDASFPSNTAPRSFSFVAPAGAPFEIVITGNPALTNCADYSLEIYGLPCPPPDVSVAAAQGKVITQWSSAYPDWHLQSINSFDGPGPYAFSNVTTRPVLVNGNYAVSNSMTAPRQFFRLAR